MSTWNRTSLLALFGAGTLALSACGLTGGDDEKTDEKPADEQSQSQEETTSSEDGAEESESTDEKDDQGGESESSDDAEASDESDDADESESGSDESDEAEESESEESDDKDEKDDSDDKDSEGDPKAVFGTEEPNLNEAWEVAKKNLEDADSVKISVKDMDASEAGMGSGTVNMEIEGKTDDSETSGTMELGDQGTLTYKVVDGTSYVKGMEEQEPELKDLMDSEGAEWISSSSSEMDMSEAGVGTMIDEMLKGVEESSGGQELADVDPETTTHDGEEVFEYREPGVKKGDKESIILIDKEGNLVSVAVEEGDAGTVTFEDWNDVDPVEAPDKDEVLDMDEMSGGSSGSADSSDSSSSESSDDEESSDSEG